MRIERIESEIKKKLGEIFQHQLSDPGLGFVTITDVKLSKDLKFAKVYYTVLGNEEQANRTKSAITRARSYIKRLLAEKIYLKFMPELRFYYDQRPADMMRIEKLLKDIREEDVGQGGS